MKQLFVCCVALGLCGMARVALAEDAPVPPAPQPREPSAQSGRRWYGWQTLIIDAASLGVLIGGIAASSRDGGATPMAVLGLAGYVAGAPALHFTYGRPAAAAGSIGLRLLLPVLGGVFGSGDAKCPRSQGDVDCGSGGLVLGAGGVLAAVVIDATALSWRPVEVEVRATPRVGFAPVLSSDRTRGELRVFGTF